MVTFGLYAVLLFAALVLVFFTLTKFWGVESAYVRTCWLPLGLLAAGYLLRRQLVGLLSYAAMLAAFWVFLVSAAWTVMGIVLVVSSRQRGQSTGKLIPATALAATPAAISVLLLLWALVTGS